MDITAPHAYRGLPGTNCLYGLSRDHGGISCGKPRGHLVHQPPMQVPDGVTLDRDGQILSAGDHVEQVGGGRDGDVGEVDEIFGDSVRVQWDDRMRSHSPGDLRKLP
jgi:hypothetical protein